MEDTQHSTTVYGSLEQSTSTSINSSQASLNETDLNSLPECSSTPDANPFEDGSNSNPQHPPSEENNEENNSSEKVHGTKLVTTSFTILGIGMLLPWNVFVSAEAYFQNRIQSSCETAVKRELDQDSSSGNHRSGGNFLLWFGLLYNLSGVFTLACMLWWEKSNEKRAATNLDANRIGGTPSTTSSASSGDDPVGSLISDSLPLEQGQEEDPEEGDELEQELQEEIERARSYQWRMIVIPISTYLSALLLTTLLVLVQDLDTVLFEQITYATVLLFGCAGSFASAGIVSFATTFPVNMAIQPYVAGQALGGAVISICNFILNSMDTNSLDSFWTS